MSRSKRKHPICGITCIESEKWDKRMANRKLRRINKELLEKSPDPYDVPQVEMEEVSNVWTFGKDGRQWIDPDEHPNIMRK